VLDKIYDRLLNLEIDVKKEQPMCKYTTFNIGGPEKIFVTCNDVEELKNTVKIAKEFGVKPFIMGNGSNLLVSDKGMSGIVIKLSGDFNNIEVCDNKITAGSAAVLSKVSNAAHKNSLAGLEFAAGIPGTVGGALYMNAGAYGGQMADVVYKTLCMDCDGNIFEIIGDMHKFGYRESCFKNADMYILSTEMHMSVGSKDEIEALMKDYNQRRKASQPLNLPSAGSVFKRPQGNYAGTLIEKAGLKGKRIGGAEVSQKHAGFIVNVGGATANDVISLVDYVKNEVYKMSGIMLEPEIRMVGIE